MSNPFCSKFTYKQFPENSTSWLDSSPDHTQRIVITRDAYFDKDMTSSAHVFNSKPSAGVIPFNSHLDPNGLQPSDNSQPSIVRQTGSAANPGNLPSSFIEEPKDSEQPLQEETMDLPLLYLTQTMIHTTVMTKLIPSQTMTFILDRHHQHLR
jgi:hypothetical protein